MSYDVNINSGIAKKELAYFNAIPYPMICLGRDGSRRWLNESATSLIDVLPHTSKGVSEFDKWFDFCLVSDRAKHKKEFRGGDNKWWLCECYPVCEGSEGFVDAFIISMRDITEQKGIEMAMQKRELKYRQLYYKAPLAFQSLNEDGCILDVNQQWIRALGYDREEVIGRWFGDFLDEESRGKFHARFSKFKQKGHTHNVIFNLVTKAGGLITGSFDGSIGRTHDGRFDRTYCVFRDITEEFVARKALKNSEEKYRNVVENANEGICIIQNSSIVYANTTCETLIGFDSNELRNSYFLTYVHPADRNLVTENHFRRLKGEDFQPYDFRLVQKNGDIKWVMFSATLTTYNDRKAVLGFLTDITKRKNTEERLIQEEEKYKLLVENLNDLVCLVDECGRYTYLNTQYEKRFSYRLSELKGQSAFSFVLKEDLPKARKIFREIKVGESREEVLRFYGRNKGMLWLNCKLQCFQDTDKNKLVEVVSTDITDTVLYQEKLQESERRYKSMFHQNGSNMVLINPAGGGCVDINAAALDFLKINKKDNQALHVYDYVVMDPVLLNGLMLQIVSKTRKYFHLKCRLGNGEIRDIEVHSGLVKVDGKEMIYAIFNDISKRKMAEQEVAINNKRLTSILKIAEHRAKNYIDLLDFTLNEALLFSKSLKGCLYIVDSEKESIVLQSCKSLLGKDVKHRVKKTVKYAKVEELKALMTSGNAFISDRSKMSKGMLQVLDHALKEIVAVPVLERGTVVALLIVSRNNKKYGLSDVKQLSLIMGNVWHIIEKQRSREELVIAKEKAEESDRLKSAFLANMSHEIRTPLNAIVGFSNLMSSESMGASERAKFNEIVERNSEQLLALIDDIIDIAKIEGEQMRLKPEEVNVSKIIEHMEMNFQELKKRHDKPMLEIKAHYPKQELTYKLDNYRFNQIFFNLIGNAIKFTDKGKIDFGLKHINSKELLFFVQDTGIGIEKSKQKIIFGEFSQEDETVAFRYGGTGLGLTITKHLVEMMNGKIWVESEKGEGAIFYFSIPRTEICK